MKKTCDLTLAEDAVVECDGCLRVNVPVTMDSAAAVVQAAERRVRAGDCALDLSAVPAVDSSALSVVLSLLRIARETGHRFSIINPPAAFGSLAALYGVDELLCEHLHTQAAESHA